MDISHKFRFSEGQNIMPFAYAINSEYLPDSSIASFIRFHLNFLKC